MPRPVEDRSDVGGAAQITISDLSRFPLSDLSRFPLGPVPLPAFCSLTVACVSGTANRMEDYFPLSLNL